MIKTFLSYRRDTSAMLANLIREMLALRHISVFVDTHSMDVAGNFPQQLLREIELCDVFICLLGEKTFESKWVKEEINFAYKFRKPLIPIFQESYQHTSGKKTLAVGKLLKSNGVTILDVRNEYIGNAIDKLERMIKSTQKSIDGMDARNDDLIAYLTTTSKNATNQHDEATTKLSPVKARVEIKLDLSDKSELDLDKLLKLLAGLTTIGINEIELIDIRSGSLLITIELPKEAALYLKKHFLQSADLFSEFKPIGIKLLSIDENWTAQLKALEAQPWDEIVNIYGENLRQDIESSIRRQGLPLDWVADIEQDTWTTATVKINEFQRESLDRFYDWLRIISLSHIRTMKRKSSKTESLSAKQTENSLTATSLDNFLHGYGTGDNPEQTVLTKERVKILEKALQQMSPRDREILLRRMINGETPRDLAPIYGLEARSVSMIFLRAKQSLERLLAEANIDDAREDSESK